MLIEIHETLIDFYDYHGPLSEAADSIFVELMDGVDQRLDVEGWDFKLSMIVGNDLQRTQGSERQALNVLIEELYDIIDY